MWLSTKDLPLQVVSRKLAPCYVGPYEMDRMVNTTVVRLKFPAALKIHPTFHVSRVKPVQVLELSPPPEPCPPPLVIDREPVYLDSFWMYVG